jgi:hypothetical protein
MSEIAERIYNCKVTSKVTKTNARHGLLSSHQFDPFQNLELKQDRT